ncbi:hypothetical protein D920_03074 [Enterococcus faecalis 13-SD-W-01]|nr:hypothetical protein D920_03074 [Enterococcus faecalis 13-SD-W-01]
MNNSELYFVEESQKKLANAIEIINKTTETTVHILLFDKIIQMPPF